MLLGGSMGSRLVSEIREELGWAYSVRAEADALRDTPALYVTAGRIDSANTAKAVARSREIVASWPPVAVGRGDQGARSAAAAGRRPLALENSTLGGFPASEERNRPWPRDHPD